MTVFVDTSALLPLLNETDDDHAAASRTIGELRTRNEDLMTHTYVVVETSALVRRRIGAPAVRALLQELIPAMNVVVVDEATHTAGVAALLAALPTRMSLVDFVSFEVMRAHEIDTAFAFDADFARAGFRTLP